MKFIIVALLAVLLSGCIFTPQDYSSGGGYFPSTSGESTTGSGGGGTGGEGGNGGSSSTSTGMSTSSGGSSSSSTGGGSTMCDHLTALDATAASKFDLSSGGALSGYLTVGAGSTAITVSGPGVTQLPVDGTVSGPLVLVVVATDSVTLKVTDSFGTPRSITWLEADRSVFDNLGAGSDPSTITYRKKVGDVVRSEKGIVPIPGGVVDVPDDALKALGEMSTLVDIFVGKTRVFVGISCQ